MQLKWFELSGWDGNLVCVGCLFYLEHAFMLQSIETLVGYHKCQSFIISPTHDELLYIPLHVFYISLKLMLTENINLFTTLISWDYYAKYRHRFRQYS